jgi:hypothetical protein
MSLSLVESLLAQDRVPKPSLPLPISVDPLSSSLSSQPITIINQKYNRVQKKSQQMNQSLVRHVSILWISY